MPIKLQTDAGLSVHLHIGVAPKRATHTDYESHSKNVRGQDTASGLDSSFFITHQILPQESCALYEGGWSNKTRQKLFPLLNGFCHD